MIDFQSSAPAIVPQGQVTIAQCFSTGTRRRKHISPGGTTEIFLGLSGRKYKIHIYPCPSVAKKGIFAKRTQIEIHKTLPVSRMRKQGLASFSKRTHFPFCGLGGSSIFNQACTSLVKVIQGLPRSTLAIQPYSRVFWKKRLFIFSKSFVAWWFRALPKRQRSCSYSVSAANYGMAGDGYKFDSLRPNRFEGERIALALALSLLAHVLIFGGYVLSRQIPALHRVVWLPAAKQPVILVQKEEQPLEFVTVQNPSTEAPQKAKYISNHNSVAADNSTVQVSENPQLTGKTDMPATADVRPQFSKSPTGADQQRENNSQASQEPKSSSNSGDLTLGKPDNGTQPQEQPRPRTLKQAYEQMKNQLPTMTMKQDGGASRHARVPSFDVKVTGFGDYDARFVEAVTQNWYNLLDSQKFSLDRTGKVVLLFRLNYDGTISQMRLAENNVGDLLGYVCEKAVLDGAPYERWNEDMRLKLGNYCDVQFTFDYYEE